MNKRAGLAGIRRVARVLVVCFVVVVVARTAPAAQHPYVTVYGSPSDPVVLRLVPELLSLGCAVRTDASPMPDPATFKEGDAVVRVTETTVTLWLLDPHIGRATEEGNVPIEDREPAGIKLTSVRVSEIVRAELLRFEPTKAPALATSDQEQPADAGAREVAPLEPIARAMAPSSPSSPSAAVAELQSPAAPSSSRPAAPPAASEPTHLSASLGALVLLPTGGAKPSLDLALSPAWHPSSSLQVRLLLAVPLTSPSVTGTGGEASISTWAGGIAVDREFRSGDDAWRGALGAGASVVLSQARGTASTGYVASDTNAVLALPFVQVGGSRALGTPRVRLGLSCLLGVALPPVVVQFDGRSVATWGPVVGGVSASLEIDIW